MQCPWLCLYEAFIDSYLNGWTVIVMAASKPTSLPDQSPCYSLRSIFAVTTLPLAYSKLFAGHYTATLPQFFFCRVLLSSSCQGAKVDVNLEMTTGGSRR